MHGLAAGSLLFVLPPAWSLPAAGFLFLSLRHFHRSQPGGPGPSAVVNLVCRGGEAWRWQTRDGRWWSGEVTGARFTSRWLLAFRLKGQGMVVLRLWRDSADEDALRRLRVQLQMSGADQRESRLSS